MSTSAKAKSYCFGLRTLETDHPLEKLIFRHPFCMEYDTIYTKSSNQSSGRCLFFTVLEKQGMELLVALFPYKKESRELPKHIEKTAREGLKKVK